MIESYGTSASLFSAIISSIDEYRNEQELLVEGFPLRRGRGRPTSQPVTGRELRLE